MTAPDDESPRWSLTLYVSGASAHSAQALETVRRLCDEELPGQVELEVVDVTAVPELRVVATGLPTAAPESECFWPSTTAAMLLGAFSTICVLSAMLPVAPPSIFTAVAPVLPAAPTFSTALAVLTVVPAPVP